jgi:hypothetical protein
MDPRTFKCKSQSGATVFIGWKTFPRKSGTKTTINPDVGINGTAKGAIENGEAHGSAEGIDYPQFRKRFV